MLEWYRPGFDDNQLIDELDELVQVLLKTKPAIKMSYQTAFKQYLNLDPLQASLEELRQILATLTDDAWILRESSQDTVLQWLFSMHIEPKLGVSDSETIPCFIYDFPATQASLAKINAKDHRVAHRFELYFKGIELANGFYELQHVKEQRTRFELDNQQRSELGLSPKPLDERFLAALEYGLPDCSGVAVGVDRLFMLKMGISNIAEVLAFSVENS
jgi:lysyl-tRNA synthetase class 2